MDESYEERLKRRAEAKKRREEQLRKRLICAGCIIAAVLVLAVALIVTHVRKNKEASEEAAAASSTSVETISANSSSELSTEATATQTTSVSAEAAPTEAAAEEGEHPWIVQTTNYVVDRSNFAVDPNIPCGSDTDNGEKVIYLTLDDGPSENTLEVLDICDRYNIKITFFVTNANPEYAYLIKEAYDRGHTIGLHTYSHDYETVYSSPEAYFQDLEAIGQVVAEQIGYVPCFIRFPGGSANGISKDYCTGIMTTLSQMVQERGYQYFDWNASSGDGGSCTDPAELANAACSFDYYENIVLLSHDGSGHEPTIQALPQIIEYYLAQGYEFRPLDRSSYHSHQTIYN